MKKDRILSSFLNLPSYIKTRKQNTIKELYAPCLKNSKLYVRGAGYFRSSVYTLMNSEVLEFCMNGGKMILLTSTEWARKDYEEVMNSFNENSLAKDFFYKELESLLDDNRLSQPTRMLVALVQTGMLEIHVGVVRGNIYHEKKGYFSDGKNFVSFDGSGNETLSALAPEDHGNAESFNVSVSWDVEDWEKRGLVWKRDLDDTLNGGDFPVERIQDVDPEFIGKWDIDLDLDAYEQAAKKRNRKLIRKWDEVYGRIDTEINSDEDTEEFGPPFMIPDDLRDHQKLGLRLWKTIHKMKGVLKHATGSGKTVTAIAAIKSEVESGGNVIVLVPGKELLYQWQEEIGLFLPNIQVGLIGDGNNDKKLLDHMRLSNEGKGKIVISIINNFREHNIIFKLKKAEKANGILLIVDECHKIGSSSYSELCELLVSKTLGLSATPERQNDQIGTDRLFQFLGPIVDTYTLEQALYDGHLSPYEYNIHTGHLTATEQGTYDDLTKEIRKQMIYKKKDEPLSDYLKHLLLSARNIVKSAEQKIPIAADIIASEYEKGQHWLIYCSDSEMMQTVKNQIMNLIPNVYPVLYWSGQSKFNRKNILRKFKNDGGIMLAIKCLDEGVDIPAISHGIIISSSKTEREWIQRRGRLLRKSKTKTKSIIYDILCLPSTKDDENRFVLDEIHRAKEFSKNALNYTYANYLLESIAEEYSCGDAEFGGEEE